MNRLIVILLLLFSVAAPAQKYPAVKKKIPKADGTVYSKPEIEARYTGSFRNLLEKNLSTAACPEDSQWGTFVIEFIVEKNGTIQAKNIRYAESSPVKSLCMFGQLKKIFLTSSGKWLPAKIKGKPVRSWHQQSIIIDPAEE